MAPNIAYTVCPFCPQEGINQLRYVKKSEKQEHKRSLTSCMTKRALTYKNIIIKISMLYNN